MKNAPQASCVGIPPCESVVKITNEKLYNILPGDVGT